MIDLAFNLCKFFPHIMMKILTMILRIILGLFLLIPAAGGFGFMPKPTAEMYGTTAGWEFIAALMNSGYMMPLIGITCLVSSVLFLCNRSALAAILLAPFTVNVIAFHLFLDASIINPSAIPAYILLTLNVYFLWLNRNAYRNLWKKTTI